MTCKHCSAKFDEADINLNKDINKFMEKHGRHQYFGETRSHYDAYYEKMIEKFYDAFALKHSIIDKTEDENMEDYIEYVKSIYKNVYK